jgi:hypothetical protein
VAFSTVAMRYRDPLHGLPAKKLDSLRMCTSGLKSEEVLIPPSMSKAKSKAKARVSMTGSCPRGKQEHLKSVSANQPAAPPEPNVVAWTRLAETQYSRWSTTSSDDHWRSVFWQRHFPGECLTSHEELKTPVR